MTVTSPAGTGYDPGFLGLPLPLPDRPGRPDDLVRLDYVHFTVVLDTARRLAALTAVVVDGGSLRDVARGDDWFLDPRVEEDQQAGPELYAANDLDRGHLVRRRDPVWGAPEVAARANVDTFAYPNAAPQAADFNQGLLLWSGLEDHVLGYAAVNALRLAVFTGPVLDPGDPVYRGIQVPRRFYKVAAWAAGDGAGGLAAAAFVLDQTPQLDGLELLTERALREGRPPPLGPFRTFQVPVADVASLTGLRLGPLEAADRFRPASRPVPEGAASVDGWTRLRTAGDIVL